MTRILLALFATSLIAATGYAADPPVAMPGSSAPAASKPLPTSPTVSPEMVAESCGVDGCSTGSCRPGLLARVSAHWCGHRCATIDPTPCTNNFPSYGSYSPVITSYASSCCVKSDDRCHRFGLGRFFGRCKTEQTRSGALSRLRAWLATGRCRSDARCCPTPTPYHTPIRYYFQPDGEPARGTEGCTVINPGGRIATGCTDGGCGAGIGGVGIGGRLRGGIGGEGGCRNGHCRKEECYGIPGSNFNGNIRFARDERPAVHPIVCSKPGEYEGSWHNDGYGAKPKEQPVQQMGHKEVK